MASYPHLIDVGIMGHCIHGKTGLCAKAGIGCYQSGMHIEALNMTVEDFRWIVEQSRGGCNQFALGGRGDPDQHENFEEILKICYENYLVPNFTTSGYGMTPEIAELCKKYCGAVAVSWYRSEYTYHEIEILKKTLAAYLMLLCMNEHGCVPEVQRYMNFESMLNKIGENQTDAYSWMGFTISVGTNGKYDLLMETEQAATVTAKGVLRIRVAHICEIYKRMCEVDLKDKGLENFECGLAD